MRLPKFIHRVKRPMRVCRFCLIEGGEVLCPTLAGDFVHESCYRFDQSVQRLDAKTEYRKKLMEDPSYFQDMTDDLRD